MVASHPLGGLVDQAGGVYSCCYSPGRRRRDPRRKSYTNAGVYSPGQRRVPLDLRARLHSNTPHAGQTRSTKHQRLGASPTSPSAWHIGFVPFRLVDFDAGRPLTSRVESRRPQNHLSLAARSRWHALPHPSSPAHQPISPSHFVYMYSQNIFEARLKHFCPTAQIRSCTRH